MFAVCFSLRLPQQAEATPFLPHPSSSQSQAFCRTRASERRASSPAI